MYVTNDTVHQHKVLINSVFWIQSSFQALYISLYTVSAILVDY